MGDEFTTFNNVVGDVNFLAGTQGDNTGGNLFINAGRATSGESNTVGGHLFIDGGKSTGNAAGGSIFFRTASSGDSGTNTNNVSLAMTIASDKKTSLAGNLELDSDSSTLSFGADQDVVLTHVADTGLRLNTNMKLQFRDSDIHISSDADGYLNVQADTGVNLNIGGTDELAITSSTATFGTNIVIPDAGTIGSATDTDAISISSGGVVNVSATTASSTSTNGALTVGGGLGVAADINVGDDLSLLSDAAVLNFGADRDVTITHVADTGLNIKNTGNSGCLLKLQTGDTVVENGNVLGKIEFESPSESSGSEAILPAVGIHAVATGDFSALSAPAKLSFKMNDTEKVNISNSGNLSLVSDSSVLSFGADSEVSLTHVADIGLTFTATTAATSGVKELLNIIHQTSGTPATGIGTDIAFTVETSDGNNEKGMILEALTTDVSSASEDFDFIVKLMAGGATAAEKMRLTSTGGLRLGASGATITGFIDEDDMLTNSATLVPTQQSVKAYVDANSGSGAVSAVANGSNNRIATFSSSDALNGEEKLTFDGNLLTLNTANTTSDCFDITADSITEANVIDITADGLTTGSALNITSTSANKSSGALVNFAQTGATTTQADFTFKVSTTATTNASAGVALFTGDALTTGKAVSISADGLTTGSALDITSTSSVMSSAKLLNLDHTVSGTGLTAKSSNLAKISSSRTETRTTGSTADDYILQVLSRTNVMNGLGGSMTSTGSVLKLQNTGTQSSGTLTDTVKGLEVSMGDVGSGTAIDVTHSNSSAIGLQLNCANGSTDIKLLSSASSNDYFTIATTASGATTITTVNGGGAAADLTFTIDGVMNLNPTGAMKLNPTGGILIAERASAASTVSGYGQIYVKSGDGELYFKDDHGGSEVQITSDGSLAGGGGGSSTLGGLDDVTMDATNFTTSLVIQTNSDGSAPTTGSLSNATDNIGIGNAVFTALTSGINNVGIGKSLPALTEGANNIAIGYESLNLLTTGSGNIALGYQTLDNHANLNNNVAIGHSAMSAYYNTTSYGSVAIGYEALGLHTEGIANIAIGYRAAKAACSSPNSAANNCIIIGREAGNGGLHQNADYTIAIGRESCNNLTKGAGNIAIGYRSLYTEVENGDKNTAIGYKALEDMAADTDGHGSNTALGYQSGLNLTTGVNNTLIGADCGAGTITGDDNTFLGCSSGSTLSSGAQNTCIGSQSGGDITTGSNNTVIGYNAEPSANNATNEITLGNSSVTALRCADTTIASLSDSRDKTNVVDSPYGLDFIDSLRPVQFTWQRRVLEPSDENHTKNGTTRVGFLAQELQSAMPNNENDVLDLVYENNPDRLEAKYGNLVPILAQAIKDLKAQNDALAARVAALESA